MRLSQLLEEKRKAKKRQAMAKTARTVGVTAIIGASVGAIGGVLFAPKSGKETRDNIKNSALDANEKLKSKASEAKVVLNDKLQASKENIADANSKIKEYLKNKKSKDVFVEDAAIGEAATTKEDTSKENVQA
ncbi:MAG: YtxH domain-containing protein [Sarcina sp.]